MVGIPGPGRANPGLRSQLDFEITSRAAARVSRGHDGPESTTFPASSLLVRPHHQKVQAAALPLEKAQVTGSTETK